MTVEPTLSPEIVTSQEQLSSAAELGRTRVFRRVICQMTLRLCRRHFRDSLASIVLMGSLAREEATFVQDEGCCRLLGDAEFLLIFGARAILPPRALLNFLRKNIEGSLANVGVVGEVHLNAAHPDYLSKLRPHIFAYELRECGLVVWGDPSILCWIPDFSAADIPLEDGWRLLSNRMVEQLEVLEGPEQRQKCLKPRLLYRTIKLYLDMATSFLLFAGEYAPSYSERARRLRILADAQSGDERYPFDLRRFCRRVAECTRWKLSMSGLRDSFSPALEGDAGFSWWEEAVSYARLLWRWELHRLVGTTGQPSNQELLERWMECQPCSRRLRGWLYVLRNQGWHRSWKNWPHWARLAWKASPRYWIYGAASELFFRLPCHSEPEGHIAHVAFDFADVRSWLPVRSEAEPGQKLSAWCGLARETVWNYEHFLLETRS
jgi:hypothetical protein